MSPSGMPSHRVFTVSPSAVAATGLLLALVFVFQLGSLSALAFLGFGALLVVLRPNAILDETARYGWIYLVPFWCLLTFFWSAYPGLTMRHGVQLGLTVVIAVTMAARLSPALLVRLIWLSFAAAAAASLLFGQVRGDGLGWLGIYGSKNAFAMAMSIYLMVSFAFVLDRRARRTWRLLGLGGVIVAFVLVLLAQSIGALTASVLAMAGGVVIVLLHRFSPTQRLLLALVVTLAMALVTLIVTGAQQQIEAYVLATTGKDTTLTGRTGLWEIALQEWARRPLIGQGYQAFWVIGNPVAEQIWADFGIATRIGFNFHNTWLSNAVEIGLVGVALQIVVLGTALVLGLRWAVWHPCAESLFFAMFLMRQTMLSMLEVVAFSQFDMASLLAICAAVYGLRARMAAKAQMPSAVTRAWIPRAGAEAPPETGTASRRA